jgi:TetR/AcrR family transcriptional regulator
MKGRRESWNIGILSKDREKGMKNMKKRENKASSSKNSVRQRLLAAATDLFARKGYAATTVREIVDSARVTKPVLYYYFQNKEGIYLELMRQTFSNVDYLVDFSRGEKGSTREKLLRFCDQAFSLFMENIEAVRVMYAIYYGPHQGAPFFDFDAYHLKFQEAIRRLVDEGVRKGEFRKGDVENMTWAILGAVNVAMEVELGHPEMGLGREGLGRVLNLIFRGISRNKI